MDEPVRENSQPMSRVMHAHLIEFRMSIKDVGSEQALLRAAALWLDEHPGCCLLAMSLHDSVDGDERVFDITVQGTASDNLDHEVLVGLGAVRLDGSD